MLKRSLVAIFVLIILITGVAVAGPDVDRVLDNLFLDQMTPYKNPQQQFNNQREFALTKGFSIGQTFVTGSETAVIARIRVYLAPYNWEQGEEAEMTLWDSPAKNSKIGSYSIKFENRFFHYHKADWNLNCNVKPNTSYYFEITYAGEGDDKLGKLGVINGSDAYKSGQGYLDGKESDFDVCFQVHSRRAPDRIGNLKNMFARINLDYPGLAEVKQAVAKEDFETAIAKTVEYFEKRQKPVSIIRPEDNIKRNLKYDTKPADDLMNGTWRDIDMEGFGGRKILGRAYLNTADDKYAKKLNDLLIQWYVDNPPPSKCKIGGCGWDEEWPSLSVGLRVGHGFVAYSLIHNSPAFTTDCRFVYITGLADHCNTLVDYGADAGGNWSFTQNSSMLTFAMNFPEFKESEIWQKTAIDRLTASIKQDILPDGPETESAPSYQRMAYNPLAGSVYDDLIKKRGLTTPFANEIKTMLEKQAEYFMYLPMPNGVTPMLGDWGHEPQRNAILTDSKRFDRSDMLYVATAGKQGKKPIELSKLYPYAGIVTMRSDWGDAGRPYDDGRYLLLHGVHFGAHGHQDLNGISALYAYGRELLTDPGSHIYGSEEHRLLTTAPSHNLMTINGEDQSRWGGTAFRNWSTTPVADYLSSWAGVYKSGAYTREVFYVRTNNDPGAKDYWIVRDIMEGKGTHSLEQRWRFVLNTPVKFDEKNLSTTTQYGKGGNLAILQITPSRLKMEQTTTNTWEKRGVDAPPAKLPTVIYSANTALPAAVDTVLFPFENKKMPAQIETLETSADGLDSAFKVKQGKIEDLFILQKKAGEKSLDSEKITFNGERVFVRRIGGKLRSILLVNGSSLTINGKQIVSRNEAVPWVVISFDASGPKVYDAPKYHWSY